MKKMTLRDPRRLFAEPRVELERRADGCLLLRSPMPLGAHSRSIGERLLHWSSSAPSRPFLMERNSLGAWQGVTYSEAIRKVEQLATGLLRQGLSAQRPLMILSDNSVSHGLLMLAAMHVGIPSVSVSPAYSLISQDHAKLKRIASSVAPGLIFASDAARYACALDAVREVTDATFAASDVPPGATNLIGLDTLAEEVDSIAVSNAFRAVGPDTTAKLLFTSGSTGEPKGVVTTQRMLCSNQQARAQIWPCLRETPPILVDWLPWSHTFGGNFNFNTVLWHGGTLYIDKGRPAPGLFAHTLANLRDVPPTIYLNVPRGYDMLINALRADPALCERFFSRLQALYYAAAALPQNLWDALQELAVHTVGEAVPLVSGWGSTETAPLATDCHFQAERSGVIGLPIPGCELKLVPNANKFEVRVRGPNVTPGYWNRSDLTTDLFDEEGFYKIGDAVRLVEEHAPERGLLFDGRVSEDFKLDSGTWVNVGMLRVRGIAALAPVAEDIVVTGHNRSQIGFLIFPNVAACRELCVDLDLSAPVEEVLADSRVRTRVAAGLARLRIEGQGSSTFAAHALLLSEPPNIDAGEITDKGYINQRAVLNRRSALVEALYSPAHAQNVISITATGPA